MAEWPAYHKWNKNYFMEDMGQTPIFFHHQDKYGAELNLSSETTQTHMSDFITRIESGEPIQHFGVSHPLYDFVSTHPILIQDVRPQTLESILPDGRFLGLGRLDSRFWPWVPPYPTQMFIAGAGTRSFGHYDPDSSHTFHWCIWGSKSVKLFPYDTRLVESMWKLKNADLSKTVDPDLLSSLPALKGLKGWSTLLHPGQTLFIPSKVWHFFGYEKTSMSYVIRARSFDSLESYCDFAADVQSPPLVIPYQARMWRKVSFSKRGIQGNLLALFEKPVIFGTSIILTLLRVYLASKRVLRRIKLSVA